MYLLDYPTHQHYKWQQPLQLCRIFAIPMFPCLSELQPLGVEKKGKFGCSNWRKKLMTLLTQTPIFRQACLVCCTCNMSTCTIYCSFKYQLPCEARCSISLTWSSKELTPVTLSSLYIRRQHGQEVRVLDLQFGGHEFKSCSDHQLDFFAVVLSSNPPSRW